LRARRFDIDGAYAQFQQARELHQAKRILEEYDSMDVQEYDDARKLVSTLWFSQYPKVIENDPVPALDRKKRQTRSSHLFL
jgi:hypothetical protein